MTEIPNTQPDSRETTILDAPDKMANVRDLFGIDSNMQVPAFSQADERVPDLDPAYVFDADTTLGPRHRAAALVRSSLGRAQYELGHTDEAHAMLASALDIAKTDSSRQIGNTMDRNNVVLAQVALDDKIDARLDASEVFEVLDEIFAKPISQRVLFENAGTAYDHVFFADVQQVGLVVTRRCHGR